MQVDGVMPPTFFIAHTRLHDRLNCGIIRGIKEALWRRVW